MPLPKPGEALLSEIFLVKRIMSTQPVAILQQADSRQSAPLVNLFNLVSRLLGYSVNSIGRLSPANQLHFLPYLQRHLSNASGTQLCG